MEGLLFNGILAFIAGILLNFTPCVLPVIPLKIRSVLHEIKGTAESRIFAAFALLLGSLLFFVILGTLTAYLGWKWGEIFQSKIFLALLSAFLFLSGGAMLFNWSFRLPQAVYRIPIHRYVGAFLIGVLAGVLATPCSGPFLGGVLAYALLQPPPVIIGIFTAVGFGLAFPYVLILISPNLMNYWPRGGLIGVQIEAILGFILIAGAVFFSQSLLPESVHPIIWVSFAFTVFIWGIFAFKRGQRISEKILPLTAVLTVLLVSVTLFRASEAPSLDWKTYSKAGLSETFASGHPALLEFTADWCLNCKVLEKTTYASPKLIEAAKTVQLIPIQVDMTTFGDEQKALLEQYGGTALPFAVLINQTGQPVQTFSGMFGSDSLEKAILKINTRQIAAANNPISTLDPPWVPKEGLALIGKQAPEWEDIDWIQGGPLKLNDLRGKVILLRFWLTVCPYCSATAPALNELWEKYHDKGLVVVGLHHPKSDSAKNLDVVKKAASELGFRFPIGTDNSWKTIRAYGVGSEFKDFTSVSFVIDQKGIIRFVHDGGEFHRTNDPDHSEHQRAFLTIAALIERLLENE